MYGFKLDDNYNCRGAEAINGNDAFDIYHKILSNIHREPYMPRYHYDKPVFYLTGLNGEAIRGYKGARNGYIPRYKHPIGIHEGRVEHPVCGWKELLEDWDRLPSMCRNPVDNQVEQDRLFYIMIRGRTHVGAVMYQNMILNYWQVTCFADLDILKIAVPHGQIGTAINAIILQRIDERLLDIPVSDGRSFKAEERAIA